MASGFMQRWKGKIIAQQLWIGSGGVIDSPSGVAGKTDYVQRLSLPVTATANTDFTMAVPTGATVLTIGVYTTTTYTAGTDCTIQIGNAAGGSQYVAATTIAAVAVKQLTLVNAAAAALLSMPAATGTPPANIFIRLVQTGTATAVGAATLVLDYTQA